MPYDALTIDTQIVYKNGRFLDRGLVRELEQYKGGLIQVVYSEIILREILKMLIDKSKAPRDALLKSIRDGDTNAQFSKKQKDDLQAVFDEMLSPEDHSNKQLLTFIKKTGAIIIPAKLIEMKPLLDAYFNQQPPFSNKGKKCEFPDAIALLSLQAWTVANDKHLLAVSQDADWVEFAKTSDRIDVVSDLGDAMASLEQDAEAFKPIAREVLRRMQDDEDNGFYKTLNDRLELQIGHETPYFDFDSPMPGDVDAGFLTLRNFEIHDLHNNTTEIEIIRVKANGFVMRVPATFNVIVNGSISFSIRDSIDKDMVPMGSTSIETDRDIEGFALIECQLDDEIIEGEEVIQQYSIHDAQVIGIPSVIDLGYIEYSIAENEYEYEHLEEQWAEAQKN